MKKWIDILPRIIEEMKTKMIIILHQKELGILKPPGMKEAIPLQYIEGIPHKDISLSIETGNSSLLLQ